jgi:mRNA interferase MazF
MEAFDLRNKMGGRVLRIQRGDIVIANITEVPGTSIQSGIRPVVVISNDKANTYSPVVTVVPLTSRINKKRYLPTHVYVSRSELTGLVKPTLVLAEQVTSIDVQSILHRCGRMNKRDMQRITNAVSIQLGIR